MSFGHKFEGLNRPFAWAGQDDRMKLKSFTLAGESFLMAGYHFAVKSAFRRARELTVSEEAKKTLYTLGRIHQEQGSFAEAQKYYEVVFTLSPDYLDVDARCSTSDARAHNLKACAQATTRTGTPT